MSQYGHNAQPVLYIVVPCYNEEEVLPMTISQLSITLSQLIANKLISKKSAMLLIDDGSDDLTWSLISKNNQNHSFVRGIKLTRNAGHQNALFAGMMHAKNYADLIISIDADLQDDIHVIQEMIAKYHEGFEVVYGIRNSRPTDTYFKRFTAETFYKMMKKMGTDIVYNHADFRLLSKRALEELSQYEESNLFLRGIIPMIGFHSTNVLYDREDRLAGKSKYPFKKMVSFALDGVTSLSVTPIRYVTGIGFMMFFISVIVGFYSLTREFMGHAVKGWTSLMTSVWLIGGIQLICLGLIGEYIGKIYKETKRRPKYHVETVLEDMSEMKGSRNQRNILGG